MIIRPGQPEWTSVEPHLDRLLDMGEVEREEYLSRFSEEEPALAGVLREMMADRSDLAAQGFLESSLVKSTDFDPVGMQVGAYTINSLIGRGGMGEVWLALRSDGRFEGRFAVKFLNSYAASPAALDRFRREGRLLARLAHPHIARLIDAGVTGTGRPYLILEYVEGERIDGYCDARSLGVEGRIRLLLEVLGALAHAHSNLVIHRDIKPSNILVTKDGDAKLLDFGIAKLLSADAGMEGESPMTRIEDSAFTPEYAAPEQILGEPPSTATDVYQVGILMFVLLAGRLPLAHEGVTRAQRIKLALDGEPQRLSDAAPAALRKSLRGDLDAIVSKALRKVPHERYATVAALADDLKRYLGNEPVAARANLLGYRMQKFARRYRAAVIGTSVAILALVVATSFALYQMREAQVQRDQSREQAKRAELQAEFVTLMMSTVGSKPTTAEQLLDAGLKLVSEHYTDDPVFRASAMLNLSARYGDLGLTQKQYALLQSADAISRKLNDLSLIARSECGLAEAEIDLGHSDRAVSWVNSGRAALDRISGPNPLYVEDCMEAEADVIDARGDPNTAKQVAERALALLELVGQTHDVRYSDLLGRIADYYKEAGDTHKGFDYSERALAAAERNGLGDTDATMIAVHNVASSLIGFGEINQGCAREKNLVARMESTGRSIITAMAVLYGACLLREGEPAGALAWYDKGVTMAQTEDDVSLQLHARGHRARALTTLGRLAEASAELDRVDALAREHALADGIPAARAQIVRAELLLAEGHDVDAQRTMETVLASVRDPKGGKGVVLPGALLWSARIALAQKRYTDAARVAGDALREYELRARDPAKSADVGEASLLLALARNALKDAAGTQRAAQQAVVSLTASLGADNALTRDALALR